MKAKGNEKPGTLLIHIQMTNTYKKRENHFFEGVYGIIKL